ncbi:MAG TPA: hypothetical protein VG055_32750 [Planctomycetaceae bacterium]|jgi:hypothetical protein|nr:hypothetical protein [Planctomycetaceae bacterium]
MAVKSNSFNLSEVIRQYRKAHRGVSPKHALEGIRKAHPAPKINEGTFKSTFYKLAGAGKRRVVRRRKPGRVVAGNGQADEALKAGLEFIRLAGGVEHAQTKLAGLAALIETAKAVQ